MERAFISAMSILLIASAGTTSLLFQGERQS